MKKLLLFFSITVLCSILGSCSIYEDIYFDEDGTVAYSIKYDVSDILAMMPAESNNIHNNGIPTDSIISIAEMAEMHKDSLDSLSDEERELLEDILPLTLLVNNDTVSKTLFMSLSGNFDNIEALNKAFISLNKINAKVKSEKEATQGIVKSNPAVSAMNYSSRYSWDGKTMMRSIEKDSSEDRAEEIEDTKENKDIMMLFSSGKMLVKYHFPRKVKSISNPDALLSQDGKTVIIEYPSSTYIESSSEDLPIEIELE